LDYGDWWLEIWDEPKDRTAEVWAYVARIVKEEDPSVVIMANPAAHWSETSVTLEGTFRVLDPYVDIWFPFQGHLSDGEVLDFLRNTSKPVGFYWTPGIFLSKRESAAYGFWRKVYWTAFQYELDLIG